MCKQLWMGMKPQPLHNGMVCSPSVTQTPTVKIWENKGDGNGFTDDSICPSTAYEVVQTSYMCYTLMCKQLWMAKEPQPLHNGMVCSPSVTQTPTVKIWVNKGDGNGLPMVPYAHPLHTKWFIQLICAPH